MVWFAYKILER